MGVLQEPGMMLTIMTQLPVVTELSLPWETSIPPGSIP